MLCSASSVDEMASVEARYDETNEAKSTSSRVTQMSTYDLPPDEPPQSSHRNRLPVPMFSREEFSIWHILRQCIGKVSDRGSIPA